MPKRHTRKDFYHKKGQKKGNRLKEYKELLELDGGELNVVEKRIEDMTSNDLNDVIVDVASKSTSVSALTSSVTSNNVSDTKAALLAAKIMLESLEVLGSSEQQSKAFEIAMCNPRFRNLAEIYNNSPFNAHPVMSAPTPSAERKNKSRNKKTAVDTINSSMNSLSTQEEKMRS